ncbi:MAG: AEC family transporter [Atopobiaceae bacterium]
MNMSAVLALQVLVMFLLVGIGYAMFRAGKITMEGNKVIGNILIYLSLPAVIIKSLIIERTPEHTAALVEGTAVALLLLVLAALVARLVCGKDAIGNFAATFSNPSFFGIPLVVATVGSQSVFYNVGFIALMNIGQWTYGLGLILHEKGEPLPTVKDVLHSIMTAPFMIAALIGIVLYATQIALPSVITTCLDDVAALNTPLAMFMIGVYLAQTNVKQMFTRIANYRVALARIVLSPLASLALLTLLPIPSYEMRIALLIAASCPVGANVAIYAQLHDADYAYAVETVVISVLLSILTVPAVVGLANAIWL